MFKITSIYVFYNNHVRGHDLPVENDNIKNIVYFSLQNDCTD